MTPTSRADTRRQRSERAPRGPRHTGLPPNPCSPPSLLPRQGQSLGPPDWREARFCPPLCSDPSAKGPTCSGAFVAGSVSLGQPLGEHCPRGLRDGTGCPVWLRPAPQAAICSWVSGGGRCTAAAREPHLARGVRAALLEGLPESLPGCAGGAGTSVTSGVPMEPRPHSQALGPQAEPRPAVRRGPPHHGAVPVDASSPGPPSPAQAAAPAEQTTGGLCPGPVRLCPRHPASRTPELGGAPHSVEGAGTGCHKLQRPPSGRQQETMWL